MNIRKIIIHELKKEAGDQNTTLTISNVLLPNNDQSVDLVNTLAKSYQGDKILYAEFDRSPGKYFPERYIEYSTTDRSDQHFIDFTIATIGNLESTIRSKVLAKGGYVLFAEYENNSAQYIAVFLIRDTEGKLLRRTQNSYEVRKVEYLDTNHLAMACRINESKLENEEPNYLSFTRLRQQEVSDYFTDWISIQQLESSTEYTNILYDIINHLPIPINPETNSQYNIDEIRNLVYDNARNNPQRTINIQTLGGLIYGDSNIIVQYIQDNHISLDTEFRYDKKALRKFTQVSVVKDGINLKFSRGDGNTKVRLSEEQSNIVIIESELFANALREQL